MSDPRSPAPPVRSFDLDAFIESREVEDSEVAEARQKSAERWEARDRLRLAADRVWNCHPNLARELARIPTTEEQAPRVAEALLELVRLAKDQALAPETWEIAPNAQPEQSKRREEQEAAVYLWHLALTHDDSKLTRSIEKLLAGKRVDPLFDAYAEWLPQMLREEYDLAAGWQRRPQTAPTLVEPAIAEPPPTPAPEGQSDTSVSQEERPAVPGVRIEGDKDERDWIVSLGGGSYRIGGRVFVVTQNEHAVLQAFLVAPGGAISKADLISQAGGDDEAPRTLKTLCKKYEEAFAPAIHCPGKRGRGGYRVRIVAGL